MYALTGVGTGDVAFVDADSKLYVKLDTGVNTGASDWSTGVLLTPTALT